MNNHVACDTADPFPFDPDYEYKPKPPTAFPHVQPRVMMEYFHHPQCAGSSGATLERIRKRIDNALQLGESGWGLHACEHWSFFRFNVACAVILAGPIYFFGYWLVKYTSDLQNASVPLFVAFAAIGTFKVLPRYVS